MVQVTYFTNYFLVEISQSSIHGIFPLLRGANSASSIVMLLHFAVVGLVQSAITAELICFLDQSFVSLVTLYDTTTWRLLLFFNLSCTRTQIREFIVFVINDRISMQATKYSFMHSFVHCRLYA